MKTAIGALFGSGRAGIRIETRGFARRGNGIAAETVHVTGNTVIDSLLEVHARIEQSTSMHDTLAGRFPYLREDSRLVLVTGHRRENFGAGFENICAALAELAARQGADAVVGEAHEVGHAN